MLDFGEETPKAVENVPESPVKKLPSLFDFISDLSHDKLYLFEEGTEKNYVPFMVNRGFSQHLDTVFIANELNKLSVQDKLMSHDFLFCVVPARKRYGKWAKDDKEHQDSIDLIKRHYHVNQKVAQLYLSLLSKEDIESIKKMYDVGGKK